MDESASLHSWAVQVSWVVPVWSYSGMNVMCSALKDLHVESFTIDKFHTANLVLLHMIYMRIKSVIDIDSETVVR